MSQEIDPVLLDKAIDRLVREGRIERTIINGKPGIKLIKKEKPNVA